MKTTLLSFTVIFAASPALAGESNAITQAQPVAQTNTTAKLNSTDEQKLPFYKRYWNKWNSFSTKKKVGIATAAALGTALVAVGGYCAIRHFGKPSVPKEIRDQARRAWIVYGIKQLNLNNINPMEHIKSSEDLIEMIEKNITIIKELEPKQQLNELQHLQETEASLREKYPNYDEQYKQMSEWLDQNLPAELK